MLVEMRFGSPDPQFLAELRDINDTGYLTWMLRRLMTATTLRDVWFPSPEEFAAIEAPQPR
jgi:hypothetical protein